MLVRQDEKGNVQQETSGALLLLASAVAPHALPPVVVAGLWPLLDSRQIHSLGSVCTICRRGLLGAAMPTAMLATSLSATAAHGRGCPCCSGRRQLHSASPMAAAPMVARQSAARQPAVLAQASSAGSSASLTIARSVKVIISAVMRRLGGRPCNSDLCALPRRWVPHPTI